MVKTKKPLCAPPDDVTVPLKHQLIKQFWMLAPAFTRWTESHMHTGVLTPQRARLMWLLLEHGPMMMSGLRNELGVTATNITALVDALEQESMVARKPHPSDRRATMITLTAKGEKQLTENCSELKDKVSELFSGLSVAEQKQFLAFLHHMRSALVERGVLEASDPGSSKPTKSKAHP